ncbi:hypothetical protein K7R23_07275 [Citrobacter rodentium NBRC 105723 = DSM 16636]|nr:hypothetical protein E2R62_15830 [Citrobacter rodentium]UHO33426.1 hypothetical protein K7R23_07275 [Citrobacter rodentium NBRC 105723 = DSM 16636]HAT8014306.1 hypothetical protein [Citrobacter rodentium NBRC 105723 = DSM 16636]HAT8019246.1 hypothetical protein [Citrobacter rodentium]HAT8028900.1 hypothetical protein [Citrobacter rodentium]
MRIRHWMLSSLLAVSTVNAADKGRLVHGPFATHDGQTLSFYQKNDIVTAWFDSPEETEERTISDYELIENRQYELGNVSVVAVFFQDLDLGGQDEVVVMYRDKAGKPHLRAWGADADQALPLTRFTPQLEKVAASLDTFTVASARKAIGRLLPQQYLIKAFPQDLPDPLFTEVLNAPDNYRHEFLRYFDELGDDVEKLDDASGYSLIFPDKFIERTSEKGENIRYTLTMDILRQGTCGNDDAGFAITGLYYQNVAAANEYCREGPFTFFGLQGCQLNPGLTGQYHNNEFDGEWTHFNAEEGRLLEKGTYRNGLREGLWQEYNYEGLRKEGRYHEDEKDGVWQTFSDTGEIIAVETWQNRTLNGLWQRKSRQWGHESAWQLEEEGHYLNGHKEGRWQENMTTQPRYAQYRNGLLDGELRETTLEGQNVISKQYRQGVVNGEISEWFANGKLKRYAIYQYGQLLKEEVYHKDSGQRYELGHWKIVSPAGGDLCKNLTDQDACDRRAAKQAASLKDGEWRTWHEDGVLATLTHWQDGEKAGAEYKFNHNGKLFSYARWDGKYYPAEETHYDYSSSDDYARKPVRMRLSADSHVLKPGLKEQTTFHSGSGNLMRQNDWCTTSSNGIAVCGKEYWWHKSGFLSSIVLQHNNRKIESTSWDDQGVISGQLIKTKDNRFSERSYFNGALFSNTFRLAKTYHDNNEEVVTADPYGTPVTHYYDQQGNEISPEELRKQRKPKNFKYISE